MSFLEFLSVVSILVVLMGSFTGLFIFIFNRFENKMTNFENKMTSLEERITHLEQGQKDIMDLLKTHLNLLKS